MKYRCNNPKDSKFANYGGKGIKCKITYLQLLSLWERDKANLMNQPSIDRIDADKDYCLTNCRFIEMSQNRKERRIKLNTAKYAIGVNLSKEELDRLTEIKRKNPKLSYRAILIKGLELLEREVNQ